MAGLILRWLMAGMSIGCIMINTVQADARVFYRYENSEGVKVLNHTIPPEYAQKGYEVVSVTGRVIKVVEPAPTPEFLKQAEEARRKQEELDSWDKSLRRRYSTVGDIEAAKKRKLLELDANIAILKTNVASLKEEIQMHQGKAANIERAGRTVPEELISSINELQLEMEGRKVQVEQRKNEREKLKLKFDRDIERFKLISKK